jgi:predicted DNA-binding transcriptional regulator AlpA
MPKFLKLADLEAIGINYNDAYLRQLEAAGKFPRRVKLGKTAVWPEDVIIKYVEAKIAESAA